MDTYVAVEAALVALKEDYRSGNLTAEEFRGQKRAIVEERVRQKVQEEQSGDRDLGTTVAGDVEETL